MLRKYQAADVAKLHSHEIMIENRTVIVLFRNCRKLEL